MEWDWMSMISCLNCRFSALIFLQWANGIVLCYLFLLQLISRVIHKGVRFFQVLNILIDPGEMYFDTDQVCQFVVYFGHKIINRLEIWLHLIINFNLLCIPLHRSTCNRIIYWCRTLIFGRHAWYLIPDTILNDTWYLILNEQQSQNLLLKVDPRSAFRNYFLQNLLRDKLITQREKRETSTQNLQRNNVARQV